MKLKDIIRIDNPDNYRLHFAKKSDGSEPLDDYMDSFEHWAGWHRTYTGRDRFPKDYIISFMNFYPKPGCSLFGGIFEVLSKHPERNDPSKYYDIRLVDDYRYLIGGIIVSTPCTGMATVMKPEEYYDSIEIVEILPKRYLPARG